MTLRIVLTQ